MKLIKIIQSKNKGKKYTAFFQYPNMKVKRIHFGSQGYTDFTLGATEKQRLSYRLRHKNDKINQPDTSGSLSYHLLWGPSRSLKTNLKEYMLKFNLQ